MNYRNPGPVTDNLMLLGDDKVNMYLLRGEQTLLVGGGISFLAPLVEQQLDMWKVDRNRISGILILHSHFDHCTAVPYFARSYPGWSIMASAGAQKVFGIPKAVDMLRNLEELNRRKKGVGDRYNGVELGFSAPRVDRVLEEGDRISLGNGLEVEILEVPGHSRCCLAAYAPALKLLFPSDATPLPVLENGELAVMANDNAPAYLESLHKMARLDVEWCAFEHGGVFGGEDGRTMLRRGVETAEAMIGAFRERLARGESVEKLAEETRARYSAGNHFEFIPQEVLQGVLTRMISTIP